MCSIRIHVTLKTTTYHSAPESLQAGSTSFRLRETRLGSALLRRMCKVRLHHYLGLQYLLCNRYYETDAALRSHWRSKVHKRRLKALKEPAYTIEEAERAAGLGKEGKRPIASTESHLTPSEVEMG